LKDLGKRGIGVGERTVGRVIVVLGISSWKGGKLGAEKRT